MQIRLDASVRTKDGERAGHVQKVIWDPATSEVRAFVVSTGGLLGHDVLVSRDVLERAARDGDEIVLDLTKDELRQLEGFGEDAYVTPPIGWMAPVPYGYPATSYLVPSESAPMMPIERAPSHEEHEHTRPAIAKGMKVHDAGGATLGTVDEIDLDPGTGELRSVTVREGGFLQRRERREIPADHLEVVGGEVHLIEESGGTRAHS